MAKKANPFQFPEARNLSDLIGKKLRLLDFTHELTRDEKPYMALTIEDIETGQMYLVGTGGVTVMKQINAMGDISDKNIEFKVIQLGRMYALAGLESNYEPTE